MLSSHNVSTVKYWPLIVLASFYEYNYIKKLFNFLQPPFPCSKYLSTTIKFYPLKYFPQILTIYMLVHRAGYALFLPRHHVIRGTIMWPLSSKKMREGDIRYWHSTAAPNTVLKSRTFSIVNPWVLRRHCGQFWYFGTLPGVNCGQFWNFVALSGVNCRQFWYFE